MRVLRCAKSLRMEAPHAWPDPLAASTVIREDMLFAAEGFQPSLVRITGISALTASAVGYFAEVIFVSLSSLIPPDALKPLYQMSKGCKGLPSLLLISAATSFTRGEETNS